MRILFFVHRVKKTRHFDGVFAGLAERGHTVILAAAQKARSKPILLPKSAIEVNRLAARDARGRAGRIELAACPVRRGDRWAAAAPRFRGARDYARFLDPRFRQSPKLRSRAAVNAPAGWPEYVEQRGWIRRHPVLLARTLALAEDAIPSDGVFEEFLRREKVDLVLVTPLVNYGSYQTDYVKSAHRLGLPVGFLPFSWDNLTNRGLIRVQPDRVLVWNDIQKQEAIDLHGTPADRIIVTGAPRFDEFFAMHPASSREEFCRLHGLSPAAPMLLYVCSSAFVAPREVDFVRGWIAAVRGAADPLVRASSIVVRPHPAHLEQWAGVNLCELPNVTRWSEHQTMNADQGLYDSLFHANAVVGLNTSAMIEAGILGKPVHTIVTEEFSAGQEEAIHFGYLRVANGGLLHEAASVDEHVAQLGAAVRRQRSEDGQERRFVERFIRPRGLSVPVTPIVVDEIERMAAIVKRRPQGTPLWHYPLRWALRRAVGRAVP